MVAAAEISHEEIKCTRPDPDFDRALCPGEGRNITSVTALFNSIPIHALPVSVNIMNNALLKYHKITDKSIEVTNHPFERYVVHYHIICFHPWVNIVFESRQVHVGLVFSKFGLFRVSFT